MIYMIYVYIYIYDIHLCIYIYIIDIEKLIEVFFLPRDPTFTPEKSSYQSHPAQLRRPLRPAGAIHRQAGALESL